MIFSFFLALHTSHIILLHPGILHLERTIHHLNHSGLVGMFSLCDEFLSQEEFELQVLGGVLCWLLQGLVVLSVLVGDGQINEVKCGANSPLLHLTGHSVEAEHVMTHVNPSHVAL